MITCQFVTITGKNLLIFMHKGTSILYEHCILSKNTTYKSYKYFQDWTEVCKG